MRRTNHRNLVNVGILSGRIPLISLVQFIAVAEHLNFRHAASHSVDRLKNSRCWSALAVCHHSGEALITYSTASTASLRRFSGNRSLSLPIASSVDLAAR
uniref:Putative transcriptional regulator protein n=1 Tax=Glaesserella parasuis TaxID=738 RepID=A0A1U9XCX6_GLAPU|nr:putative transcriptional regulator protein [Glaesserella parasuis]WEG85505.1 putative transcriptional regulator protein [Actinobacillus indolicus]WEG85489.1 putative transcriptional regulator protein [Glaesserella parasuis]WEG85492.1 putative transcriptional regulator protein [Glaesserella parasuis]WEG85495.1 putative transcriptional regulator protein [Glaesserella parasuis]